MPRLLDIQLCQPCNACTVLTAVNSLLMAVEEESHYISSSHIRLIRILTVIVQASCSEIITSFPAISGLIRHLDIPFCKHSSVKRTLIISTANVHLFQTHHNDGYAWPFLDSQLHESLTKTGIHDLQNLERPLLSTSSSFHAHHDMR